MYVYLLRSAARTTFEPSELVLSLARGAVYAVCKGGGNVQIIVDCCTVFKKITNFSLNLTINVNNFVLFAAPT